MINGTVDPIMPWQGGEIGFVFKNRGKVLSSENTFKFWVMQNECRNTGEFIELPDIKDDGTNVIAWYANILPGTGCNIERQSHNAIQAKNDNERSHCDIFCDSGGKQGCLLHVNFAVITKKPAQYH